MTPPSGTKKSSKERSTIYELCKKRIELRNQELQKSQSQTNSSEFGLRLSMQPNCKSPNENSNIHEVCGQYVERQQKKVDDIKGKLQSTSMSNKSEFFIENMNSFLEIVPTVDQLLSEKTTCAKSNKDAKTKYWLNFEELEMNSLVCPICLVQFQKRTELDCHVKEIHGKKRGRPAIPMECSLCQKKFTNKKDFTYHYRTHSDKTYECPSCKKICFFDVFHTCKEKKYEKHSRRVWDDCKKVLIKKPIQQVSSGNSKFVPKLPISKNSNASLNIVELKSSISPSDKMVINFTPFIKKNKIINPSNLNSNIHDQDSVELLLGEFKHLDDHQSDNQSHFETETMSLANIDDTNFYCKICGMSFKEIEKYETHYSTHLDEELCQISEGDEELHVCFVCGGCFTEINTFQAHKLTHADKDIKKLD